MVLSWAGTRGVITLAAIFTLPLATSHGSPFPGRDLLLFCAYLVVVVTLVGQGVTFAPEVRALGVRADPADAASLRNQARAAAVQAGLDRLDQIAADGDIPEETLARLRAGLDHRARRYQSLLERPDAPEDEEPPASPGYHAALRARRAVIDAEREELLRWRDAGRNRVKLSVMAVAASRLARTVPRAASPTRAARPAMAATAVQQPAIPLPNRWTGPAKQDEARTPDQWRRSAALGCPGPGRRRWCRRGGWVSWPGRG